MVGKKMERRMDKLDAKMDELEWRVVVVVATRKTNRRTKRVMEGTRPHCIRRMERRNQKA